MTLSQRAVEAALSAYVQHPVKAKGDAMDAMKSALTAYHAALAVDGLCLVPKDPTARMLGRGAVAQFEAEPNMKVEATWDAMIAAASDGEERK